MIRVLRYLVPVLLLSVLVACQGGASSSTPISPAGTVAQEAEPTATVDQSPSPTAPPSPTATATAQPTENAHAELHFTGELYYNGKTRMCVAPTCGPNPNAPPPVTAILGEGEVTPVDGTTQSILVDLIVDRSPGERGYDGTPFEVESVMLNGSELPDVAQYVCRLGGDERDESKTCPIQFRMPRAAIRSMEITITFGWNGGHASHLSVAHFQLDGR